MTTEPRHLRRPVPRPADRSLVTRRRRRVDPPTVHIAPVMPAWKISRRHAWVLGLIGIVLAVLFVEPVRNLFLLAAIIAVATLAELLSALGDGVVWVGDDLIHPVLTEVFSWF